MNLKFTLLLFDKSFKIFFLFELINFPSELVVFSKSVASTSPKLDSSYFIIDSEEKISSQFYFVRARNEQFNYTTNPSFTDNTGTLNNDSFIDNQTTFITTIGLYNDSNDLVAVAKVSQPVTKDFTKESLIRVKLDY